MDLQIVLNSVSSILLRIVAVLQQVVLFSVVYGVRTSFYTVSMSVSHSEILCKSILISEQKRTVADFEAVYCYICAKGYLNRLPLVKHLSAESARVVFESQNLCACFFFAYLFLEAIKLFPFISTYHVRLDLRNSLQNVLQTSTCTAAVSIQL